MYRKLNSNESKTNLIFKKMRTGNFELLDIRICAKIWALYIAALESVQSRFEYQTVLLSRRLTVNWNLNRNNRFTEINGLTVFPLDAYIFSCSPKFNFFCVILYIFFSFYVQLSSFLIVLSLFLTCRESGTSLAYLALMCHKILLMCLVQDGKPGSDTENELIKFDQLKIEEG